MQHDCETAYFFSGAFSAAGFASLAAASFFAGSDFFSVFAGSFLAASSARAAKEVARMRAAISFFMDCSLGLRTARSAKAPAMPQRDLVGSSDSMQTCGETFLSAGLRAGEFFPSSRVTVGLQPRLPLYPPRLGCRPRREWTDVLPPLPSGLLLRHRPAGRGDGVHALERAAHQRAHRRAVRRGPRARGAHRADP